MLRTVAAFGMLTLVAAPIDVGAQDIDYSNLIRTRDLTGSEIYTTNDAYDEGAWADATFDAVGTDWNQIGEVEDVILNSSGEIAGIVAEVGGFLDIGDKHVLLGIGDLTIVREGENDFALVTRWNEEQLEELPDVDEGWWN